MARKATWAIVTQLMLALPAAALAADDVKLAPASLPTQVIKIPEFQAQLEFVKLPAGEVELKIANLEPRKVAVKSVWMCRTEIPWEVYDVFAYGLDIKDEKAKVEAIAKTRPSKPYGAPDFGFGHNGYPCLAVTYYSAETFCQWLSAKTGKKFRLPTEAEWEYACRADGKAQDLEKTAWFAVDGEEGTHPVAKKDPNAWGLYDMLGNAVEWVVKDEKAAEADKAEEAESGKPAKPVARGGSWKLAQDKLSATTRQKQAPSWNVTDPQDPKSKWWLSDGTFVSFRVVMEE